MSIKGMTKLNQQVIKWSYYEVGHQIVVLFKAPIKDSYFLPCMERRWDSVAR